MNIVERLHGNLLILVRLRQQLYEIHCSWLQGSILIVNLLTLGVDVFKHIFQNIRSKLSKLTTRIFVVIWTTNKTTVCCIIGDVSSRWYWGVFGASRATRGPG